MHALAVPPVWMQPNTDVIAPDRAPGVLAVVTAAGVLVALGLATARGLVTTGPGAADAVHDGGRALRSPAS